MLQPKVSVILINYNNTQYTKTCVDSIAANRYPSLLVYIVDNGSNTHHQRLLQSLQKRYSQQIKLISLGYNAGFTKANNAGIKQALAERTDYIWILNNDTEVGIDAVKSYVGSFEKFKLDTSNSIVSSIITIFGTGRIWCNGMYDLPLINFPKSRHKQQLAVKIEKDELTLLPCQYSVGCSMFFHKNLVKINGMMNEQYFIYYDDLDFSFGKKNYFIQKALVDHKVSATSGKIGSDVFTPFQAYLHGKNAILFYFKKKMISIFEKLVFLCFTMWLIIFLYIRSWKSLTEYLRGVSDGLKSNL